MIHTIFGNTIWTNRRDSLRLRLATWELLEYLTVTMVFHSHPAIWYYFSSGNGETTLLWESLFFFATMIGILEVVGYSFLCMMSTHIRFARLTNAMWVGCVDHTGVLQNSCPISEKGSITSLPSVPSDCDISSSSTTTIFQPWVAKTVMTSLIIWRSVHYNLEADSDCSTLLKIAWLIVALHSQMLISHFYFHFC